MSNITTPLELRPVTPDRWPDLEALFGPSRTCNGCWCMWYRETRSEFERAKGEANRVAMRSIVEAGRVPGLLAYAGDKPVGWVSVAPREEFTALERSRVAARVDDQPVWSIVCFFVARGHRRQGVMTALLRGAVAYAREHGAKIVEGYPIEPGGAWTSSTGYVGFIGAFQDAGFVEVARRSPKRPVMRNYLKTSKVSETSEV